MFVSSEADADKCEDCCFYALTMDERSDILNARKVGDINAKLRARLYSALGRLGEKSEKSGVTKAIVEGWKKVAT